MSHARRVSRRVRLGRLYAPASSRRSEGRGPMTITNRPRVGGPATNDEVQHVRYDCSVTITRPPGRTRRLRLRSAGTRHPRRARQRRPDPAHRPQRHGQDVPAQLDQRGARSRASPLQRQPDLVRRPRGVSLPRRSEGVGSVSRNAGHRLGRGVGAHRRDQPLQARAPESPVLARPRAEDPGTRRSPSCATAGRR